MLTCHAQPSARGPLILSVLFLLLGCGTKTESKDYVDEGAVCLRSSDQRLVVEVTSPGCLSSSCTAVTDQSCSISVDGETITVSSLFVIERDVGPNLACTDDCGVASCTAESVPLEEGAYEVVYGDRRESVSASGNAQAITLFADDSPLGAYRCEPGSD